MVSSAEMVWKDKFLNRVWISVIIHSEVLIQVNIFVFNVYQVPDTEKKRLFFFTYLDKRKSWLILETASIRESKWIWNLNDWFDHFKSPNYAMDSVDLFLSQTSCEYTKSVKILLLWVFNWRESEGNRHFCAFLTSWQAAGPAVVCDCQRHRLPVQHCEHVPWLLWRGQSPGGTPFTSQPQPSLMAFFPIPIVWPTLLTCLVP